ncbi:MAG TPA: hydroxyisourate hydrolase [Candidatus Obscuribacterales bacterium]
MSRITTHVLDLSRGKPAHGIVVVLERRHEGEWTEVTSKLTNADGRIPDLVPEGTSLKAGIYRLVFGTEPYFKQSGLSTFYPYIPVVFELKSENEHYHVPLLLSPFGYSTYRGS